MAVDQRGRAGKIWPILVELVSARKTLTHVELGPRVGILHRNLRPPLDVIAQHCRKNQLPPLTAVIVNADTGKPAALEPDADVEGAMKKVHEFEWNKIKNPFELFSSTK